MIQPLSLTIGAFLGDSQAQSVWSLPSIYSSSGSQNLYINKLGQIRTIDGFTRQAEEPYLTNTGGSSAMVRGLYMFRRIAAGTTTRQLMIVLDDQVNEWELWSSTDLGVSQTFIADLGASSVGYIPDWATFGDQLFITNGVMTPRMWDGTTLTLVGGTQLAAPTLADGGAGALNGAGYKYKVIPILANKVRKIGSVASASLDVQNRCITVSWTADADSNVLGYEIWRTTGSGLDFYLVAYSDGRTVVSFTDVMTDRDLLTRAVLSVVASHGDAPPAGLYFCVPHKGRMWWGRTDTFPRRWYWSDPGDPDSVYTDRNYTDCTDAKSLGDVSTGGTGDFEGMIVLWHEKTVWTISGTGQIVEGVIDWRKRRSNAKTGAVTHRAVVRVSEGAVYLGQEGGPIKTRGNMLAFLTPQKDVRLFDGQNDTIISFPKKDTLARLTKAHAHKAYAYDDEDHGMYVWVLPVDGGTEPSLSVAWNYWYGTWHEWPGTNFGHVVTAESSANVNLLIAGEARTSSGAFLYQLWSGGTQAGADIVATFMSKPIYPPLVDGGPPNISQEKRLESILLLFEKEAFPVNFTFGFLPHDAADGDTPTIVRAALNASSRVRIPARMGPAATNPGKFFFGTGWRLKLTSTASGPWTLKAMDQTYLPLAGQTR